MMVETRCINLFFLTLWISQIYSFQSRGPPKILGRDFKPLQVINAGQEFRVACPIDGDPSPNVDWYKDGEPITSAWTRFRLSSNSKALRIRTVLTKDSGIYECKGVNGFGSIIARTRLVVTDESGSDSRIPVDHSDSDSASSERISSFGPTFTEETLEQSGPLHISSGNSIRFKCDTKGSPTAKVMWYKDGKAVSEKMSRWSSWTLALGKLTSEDSGIYSCKVSNLFGKIEFNIQLEVTELIDKKKPNFLAGFPTNVTVIAGNEAVIECVVRGGTTAFPPHIKWLKRIPQGEAMESRSVKNKHLIPVENQHVLVIQDSEDDGIRVNGTQVNGTYVSRLTFRKASPGITDGVYVCLATNNVGYNYKESHLTVLPGAQTVESSSSEIPFPLIVFVLSITLSLLVISSACCFRSYQKTLQKQPQARTRQFAAPSVSGGSSSISSSFKKNCAIAVADQRQLLAVPNMPSSPLRHVMCRTQMEPAIEIAVSRLCSYCGDETSDFSAIRHCYSGSYVCSMSHRSLHCGSWA